MARHLVDPDKFERRAKEDSKSIVAYKPDFVKSKAEMQEAACQSEYERVLTHGTGFLPAKSGKDVKRVSKVEYQIAMAEMQERTSGLNEEDAEALRFMKKFNLEYTTQNQDIIENKLRPQFEQPLTNGRGYLPAKSGKDVQETPEIDLQIYLGQREMQNPSLRSKNTPQQNSKLVSDLSEFRADMTKRQRIANGEIVFDFNDTAFSKSNCMGYSFKNEKFPEKFPIYKITNLDYSLEKMFDEPIDKRAFDSLYFPLSPSNAAQEYGLPKRQELSFDLAAFDTPNKLYERFLIWVEEREQVRKATANALNSERARQRRIQGVVDKYSGDYSLISQIPRGKENFKKILYSDTLYSRNPVEPISKYSHRDSSIEPIKKFREEKSRHKIRSLLPLFVLGATMFGTGDKDLRTQLHGGDSYPSSSIRQRWPDVDEKPVKRETEFFRDPTCRDTRFDRIEPLKDYNPEINL